MTTADIKDISMTYSSALEIARAIDDKRLDFNGMRDTLDRLVDSLSSEWEGTAQREFLTAYNKLKPKLKTISETMERYSTEIRATVAAEEEQEQASASGFHGISSWFMPSGIGPESKSSAKEGGTCKPKAPSSKKSGKSNSTKQSKDQVPVEKDSENNSEQAGDTGSPPESVPDRANVLEVNTPLLAQKTHYNCAFASGSMLLNAAGISATEDDIIRITGGDNNLYEVNKAMNQLSGGRFSEIYCPKEEGAFRTEIENSLKKGVPVQVNVFLPTSEPFGYTSDGHYVVVTGMYEDSEGVTRVTINDPYSPEYFRNGTVQGQTLDIPLSTLSSVRGHEYLIVGA